MAAVTSVLVCEVCEREFPSPQALGGHRYRVHGLRGGSRRSKQRQQQATTKPEPSRALEAPELEPGDVRAKIRATFESVSGELRAQLAELEQTIEQRELELKDLREARGDLRAIIGRVAPGSLELTKQAKAVSNGSQKRAAKDLAAKVEAVEKIITTEPKWSEGFTSNRLADDLSERIPRGLSTKVARTVLEELRERGVVRHDRVVKGGGMQFKLVSADEVFYRRNGDDG